MRFVVVISSLCAFHFACSSSSGNGTGVGAPPPSSTGPAADAAAPGATLGTANGTVAEWQSLSPMPLARANHCATYANGYLVVIGGNYKPKGAADFKSIADVHVAKVGLDGTLGAWSTAGTLPSGVNSCTATSDGKRVLVLDGIFDKEADASKVWSATLSDDGKLDAFAQIGALPAGTRVLYSSAWVDGATLLAMHAKLDTEGNAISLLRATLGDSVSGWSDTDWNPGFRGHPTYAYSGKFVYSFGGYATDGDGGLPMQSDGHGAPLDDAKKPGASFSTGALPKPTGSGSAAVADGYVFFTGGKDEVFAGKGRADVWSAKIKDDGTLDAWATQPSMPQGRTSHVAVVAGNFLYVTGGGYEAGGLDNVYSARVRF